MKVKELIKELQSVDPEAEVLCVEDFYNDGNKMRGSSPYVNELLADEDDQAFFINESGGPVYIKEDDDEEGDCNQPAGKLRKVIGICPEC